jgi:hypothetical protein
MEIGGATRKARSDAVAYAIDTGVMEVAGTTWKPVSSSGASIVRGANRPLRVYLLHIKCAAEISLSCPAVV